jgi:hypothetical protein
VSQQARSDLASEWREAKPQTAADILSFYKYARGMGADLDAWHADPTRRAWTEWVAYVAKKVDAKFALDIGAGAGHDLRALRAAGVPAHGVEPNDLLRTELEDDGFTMHENVDDTDCIGKVDLITLIDVLEHISQPENFLDHAIGKAKIGCILVEATATHDNGTPLHLKENRGWQPGRYLEQHGWWVMDQDGRLRIWEKRADKGIPTATLLAAVSRAPQLLWTANRTTGVGGTEWRMRANIGDALLTRSRSVLAYNWWIGTGDDVFLMVDDDINFSKRDADRAVQYCRDGYDIMCGGYPVRDGSHLACRFLPNMRNTEIVFGPGQKPIEIMYAATGFMAVHRRVLDGLTKVLPLVSSGEPWYYPFFQELFRFDEQVDGMLELSEDWGFCELARDAGFKVWLDPQAILSHEGRTLPLTVTNMKDIAYAISKA